MVEVKNGQKRGKKHTKFNISTYFSISAPFYLVTSTSSILNRYLECMINCAMEVPSELLFLNEQF